MRSLEPDSARGTVDDATLAAPVAAALRAFLAETFGREEGLAVEQEWTGVLGFTTDGRPLVGELPTRPRGCYVAAGYNGHGMPQCFGTGKAVARMIAAGGGDGIGADDSAGFARYIRSCSPARFPELTGGRLSSHM